MMSCLAVSLGQGTAKSQVMVESPRSPAGGNPCLDRATCKDWANREKARAGSGMLLWRVSAAGVNIFGDSPVWSVRLVLPIR